MSMNWMELVFVVGCCAGVWWMGWSMGYVRGYGKGRREWVTWRRN